MAQQIKEFTTQNIQSSNFNFIFLGNDLNDLRDELIRLCDNLIQLCSRYKFFTKTNENGTNNYHLLIDMVCANLTDSQDVSNFEIKKDNVKLYVVADYCSQKQNVAEEEEKLQALSLLEQGQLQLNTQRRRNTSSSSAPSLSYIPVCSAPGCNFRLRSSLALTSNTPLNKEEHVTTIPTLPPVESYMTFKDHPQPSSLASSSSGLLLKKGDESRYKSVEIPDFPSKEEYSKLPTIGSLHQTEEYTLGATQPSSVTLRDTSLGATNTQQETGILLNPNPSSPRKRQLNELEGPPNAIEETETLSNATEETEISPNGLEETQSPQKKQRPPLFSWFSSWLNNRRYPKNGGNKNTKTYKKKYIKNKINKTRGNKNINNKMNNTRSNKKLNKKHTNTLRKK
jgi:hypothetical protein